MKGCTFPEINVSGLMDCLTYVQINIYNTNIKSLKERGVDIQHLLEHTGYRSIIMDVPILNPDSSSASKFNSLKCLREVVEELGPVRHSVSHLSSMNRFVSIKE
ncbi:unnamed protein product [Strongylus vulgaris]|uniref:Uncharacterized protein n=1 Tax=Strongylus vulgaris TaxID=40348 RepID=A0A3P7M359_STRVU|nr:unnamed protein product [Strongylus vulgaris]